MINMKDWNILKKELLSDPQVAAEYKKLEPEFRLASELIRARREQRLSQEALAKKAGTSQVVIARLESGTSNPTIGTLEKVAKALDKSLTLSIS